jgi:hypothetical protein
MTIHLVYPHKNLISAPNVIGYKLSIELRKYFDVVTHDWDSIKTIRPNPGDILIGHSHPIGFTIFRNSAKLPGWSRKILMQPFNCDYSQVSYIDDVIDECDLFLAITGDYWFKNIKNSSSSRWLPKMKQLNLAVDREHFPKLKKSLNPPGERKFLYIGNDHRAKNLSYLSSIATKLCAYEFAWAGKGAAYSRLKKLGYIDFSTSTGRQIIGNYDFMITVGLADANPTTILEALSWGLIPICTETSGYTSEFGIVNIPNDDVDSACSLLSDLQFMESDDLARLAEAGDRLLTEKYNWQSFFSVVSDALFSDTSPAIPPKSVTRRSNFSGITLKSFIRLIVNNLIK